MHEKELSELTFDKNECQNITDHLKDTSTVSKDYRFFQEIRQYILNLVGCLREKYPEVKALESSCQQLWRRKARMLVQRRLLDRQDEYAQFSGALIPPKTTTRGAEYVARTREREARRTRRAASRQITRKRDSEEHHDGMSTDDEDSRSYEALYDSEMTRVRQAQRGLFADVEADFGEVSAILRRFRVWRGEHANSYYDAFISLCVPQVLIPFVRYSLISWNPLQLESSENWENFEWYREAAAFAVENLDAGGVDERDRQEEVKIIATIVEKSIFKRVELLVTDVWDPMSTRQTRLLESQLEMLTDGYPFMNADAVAAQQLVRKLCKRVQTSIGTDVYIPFVGDGATEPAARFFERQCWSAIKLFRNIMLLSSVLSFSALRELAFEGLLDRYLLLSLQMSPLDDRCLRKCASIVEAIPVAFVAHEDAAAALEPLRAYIKRFKDTMKAAKTIGGLKMEQPLEVLLTKVSR